MKSSIQSPHFELNHIWFIKSKYTAALANKIFICLVKNKMIGNTNQESTSLVKHAKSHLDTL